MTSGAKPGGIDMHALPDAVRERLGPRAAHDLEEYATELGTLRLEMQKGFSELRVEVLRWSLLFWIGQLAAIAAMLSFMLNRVPR